MRTAAGFHALVSVSLLLSPSLDLFADDGSLISEAKKEKKLVVYMTPFPPNPALVAAFAKRYPFLDVESVTAGGPDIIAKFEHDGAGPQGADVVLRCEHPYLYKGWYRKGWLARLDRVGGYREYPAWAKQKNGDYIRFAGFRHGYLYNPRFVAEKDLPNSYAELLKPAWKGRFFLPPMPGHGDFLANFLLTQKDGMDTAMLEQGKEFPGQMKMIGALMDGSVPIALARDLDGIMWSKKRPELRFHLFADSPYQYADFGLVSKRKHSAAGELFAGWLMSQEARNVMDRELNGGSLRSPEELASHGIFSVDIESGLAPAVSPDRKSSVKQ